jgi:uncharacterized protein (DUF302 family)
MSYYFSKTVDGGFPRAVERTIEALKAEGFGIITDIDVSATFAQKLGVSFPNYRILGACNPKLAFEALKLEDKIGTMLPCNVVVRERPDRRVEIAAIDPVASMEAVENPRLKEMAGEVRERLAKVIAAI